MALFFFYSFIFTPPLLLHTFQRNREVRAESLSHSDRYCFLDRVRKRLFVPVLLPTSPTQKCLFFLSVTVTMFEEALQKAPREELVEHIRLQRELIQRLHRRVIELEASLERAMATSTTFKGSDNARDSPLSSSPVREVNPTAGKQKTARGATAQGRVLSNATLTTVSSRAREPANSSASAKQHTPSMHARPQQGENDLSHLTISKQTAPSGSSDDACVTSAAPEPRHELPVPHAEKHADALPAPSPPQLTAQATSAPSTSVVAVRSSDALRQPSTPPSPSAEHPTVLEGIKEINYVLAAHRAGRPALPLPVVEELEEIRSRLLQGFKQTYIAGVSPDSELSEYHEARPFQMRHVGWARDERSLDDVARSRISTLRQSCGIARGEDGEAADRVCPRWVSPDSSRVVYGESPRRR